MDRKLATIEIIKDIRPIENADSIEVATVRGWHVVVKKGEFGVGDLCIYCEIDSILPPRPEFAFLEKVHYRIKTIKLRGCLSQGIIFPITILTDRDSYKVPIEKYRALIGNDVTDVLNITKYEPPTSAQLVGKVKGNFPSFVPKTDVERIQNMQWVLNEYKDELFYVSEKLDGTSATFYYNNGIFGVCSRNLDLIETEDNTYWKVARELRLEEKMSEYSRLSGGFNFALQGELVGEGIQKNKYKLKGQTVFFFSIFDIDKQLFYNYNKFIYDIKFEFGLKTVPIISDGTGFKLLSTIDDMLKFSEGKSILNPDQEREGIVIKPEYNIVHPIYGNISFKVINNKYLLKNE